MFDKDCIKVGDEITARMTVERVCDGGWYSCSVSGKTGLRPLVQLNDIVSHTPKAADLGVGDWVFWRCYDISYEGKIVAIDHQGGMSWVRWDGRSGTLRDHPPFEVNMFVKTAILSRTPL